MMTDIDVPQSRSPRYPRYPLAPAIAYAKRLYEGAHRTLIDTDTAYKVMGFAGKSGASTSALGAVRQYGLIEAPKGGVRISNLGLQVLEPRSTEEYVESLHIAANQPTVFAQIMGHFSGELPRSDEPIRAYLIRTLDFSKKGADECILSLRETFSFAGDATPTLGGEKLAQPSEPPLTVASGAETNSLRDQQVSSTAFTDSYRIPLTKECTAEIRFIGEVTGQAVERLVRHIELMKEVWTEE